MYTYVTKGEVKPYKSICRSMLQQMVNSLKKRYGITAQIQLIGSGANNLVMLDMVYLVCSNIRIPLSNRKSGIDERSDTQKEWNFLPTETTEEPKNTRV